MTEAPKPAGFDLAAIASVVAALVPVVALLRPPPSRGIDKYIPALGLAIIIGLGGYIFTGSSDGREKMGRMSENIVSIQSDLKSMKMTLDASAGQSTKLTGDVANNGARIGAIETEQSRMKDRLYSLENSRQKQVG